MSKKRPFIGALFLTGFVASGSTWIWAYQTDQGIESSLNNSYVFNTYLKNDNINVQSHGGIVTLKGTVADDSHKTLAQETAQSIPDVKGVDNELQVKNSMPAQLSDDWIRLKVKAILLYHRNVSATRTHVDVKDGVVTLSGVADSEAQKELTAEYAKNVDGVKGVFNSMTIKEEGQNTSPSTESVVDDASITAQVKMTLFMHQSTSAIHTHVKTVKGIVTLTGTAGNEAEKSLATELVKDINGVKGVVNEMDVMAN